MDQRYIVALGSNRRHHRHGSPRAVLKAALAQLGGVEAAAPIVTTAPLGHTRRRYANGAALVRSRLMPEAFLIHLKAIERRFGRRARTPRWGDRVLDLDVLLWSGGPWASSGLTVPHIYFRERLFALGPAARIAPLWRDPLTGLTLRQLEARLTRSGRLPIGHSRSGP